jgi:hypothetical protein
MVMSFVLGSPINDVGGIDARLILISGESTLPEWWQFRDLNSCRRTSLTLSPVSPVGAVNCADWAAGNAQGGIGTYQLNPNSIGSNSVALWLATAIPLPPVNLNANQEYFAGSVVIDHAKSVGDGACAGCAPPMCIVLDRMSITRSRQRSTAAVGCGTSSTSRAGPGTSGAGGLHALCRTADEGARWQHVGANGELAPGFATGGISPVDGDAVLVPVSLGSAGRIFGATGKDGGLIVTWRDLRAAGAGARARWLEADGTPDPSEPAAGRLVAADADPYAAYVLAALDDGQGGAYVLWSADARLPYWSTAYLTRAFASDVLDAGRPTAPALELSIGPNPARDVLTVHATLPLAGRARLALHDLAGRLVAAREIHGAGRHVERLGDLATLAPGLYVVSIAQGKSVRSARVAVIR